MAGTITIAPIRHDPIDTRTRYPKNLIDINPEKISAENPAITLNALIIMLLPMVFKAELVASGYVRPFLICRLKHQIY
jgi:hypothetical protein